jgi:NAD+ kinase
MATPTHEGRPSRIGVVVHPSRDIGAPFGELRGWAQRCGAEIVQVPVPGATREVAEPGEAATCTLIVSIGGDGTMLAAIRAGMAADRPVLGVACGSLGVLTRTAPGHLADALDRFSAGAWRGEELPALELTRDDGTSLLALNDLVVVRAGIGQILLTVHVDGVLAGRLAGDGVIVSTPLGSSAYSLAAGGPLLGPGTAGLLLTPLASHGAELPPIVLGPDARLDLELGPRYGGARLEVDGQIVSGAARRLQVSTRQAAARLVAFDGEPPLLSVLRNRGILLDSPRILAEDARRVASGD